MEKERRSTKPRTVVPEHVRAVDDWQPAPGQGAFGGVRDGEKAAADFLAKAEEPEPED